MHNKKSLRFSSEAFFKFYKVAVGEGIEPSRGS